MRLKEVKRFQKFQGQRLYSEHLLIFRALKTNKKHFVVYFYLMDTYQKASVTFLKTKRGFTVTKNYEIWVTTFAKLDFGVLIDTDAINVTLHALMGRPNKQDKYHTFQFGSWKKYILVKSIWPSMTLFYKQVNTTFDFETPGFNNSEILSLQYFVNYLSGFTILLRKTWNQ